MRHKLFFHFAIGVLLLCALSGLRADTLYSDKAYVGLVSDPRAARVGQTLTVLIYEQATAATSADRETNKSIGFSGQYDEVTATDGVRTTDAFSQYGADASTRSEGGGTISRSGRLVASVSVSVMEILPSGELHVRGQQLIEFNEETQFIKVEGRVRPEDISADNTVISTRLADAQISYVGDGLLGRQQKPGLITRVLGWLF
jgi:flagellar L-ring protein precursor FlgH